MFPLAVEKREDEFGKFADVYGLGDVTVASGGQGSFPVSFHDPCRQGDHGDLIEFRNSLDQRGGLIPVDAWNPDVHEDQIGFFLLCGTDGTQPVIGFNHDVMVGLENPADQFFVLDVVFYIEDLVRHRLFTS